MKKSVLIPLIAAGALTLSGLTWATVAFLSAKDPGLSETIEVYETTGTKGKLLSRQTNQTWTDYAFNGNTEVAVNPKESLGDFHGTGVALTHSSAYMLMSSDSDTRSDMLETLFGVTGARIGVVRIPIGTSDYTYTDHFYSLDDVPSGEKDYTLESFSTTEDERYLVPVLQEIVAINPNIRFIGAPWSAPAWMKTTDSLIGGTLIGSSGSVTTEEEDAFARYLVRFVSAYQSFGLSIDYLSLCNEPSIANVHYPSMQMGTNQYLRIGSLVSQYLNEAGFATKIMAYDHNVGSESDTVIYELFADAIYDSDFRSRVSGIAFHSYGASWPDLYPTILQNGRESYSGWEYYVTEMTESAESFDFAANMAWTNANVTIGPVSYGSSMAVYWNAVLSPSGQPILGNDATCYGLLTLDGNQIRKSPSFFAFSHLSSFAYPIEGEEPTILDTYSDNQAKIKAVSFKRGDGSFVYVLSNQDATTYEDVNIVMNGQMVTYRIMPQSTVTLVALARGVSSSPLSTIPINHVEMTQTELNQFDFEVHLEGAYPDAQFYVTDTDAFSTAHPLDAQKADEHFVFNLSRSPGDLYLWVTSGDLRGVLAITLPKMSPRVVLENENATVHFNLDLETSWSSFCDPYGKAVYRSASPIFDNTSERVNQDQDGQEEPIYILSDFYVDQHYNAEKPYYFIVMNGKNERTQYVSGPVLSSQDYVQNEQLSLIENSSLPTLSVIADPVVMTDTTHTSLLVREVGGESFTSENEQASTFQFSMDLSVMTKPGVWYDILLLDLRSGATYDLPYEKADLGTLTLAGRQYAFYEWEGAAKIAFQTLSFSEVSAHLSVDESLPILHLDGHYQGSVAHLNINYWNGSTTVNLLSAENQSGTPGHLAFEVDLSLLTAAGTYYDIVLEIDSSFYDLPSSVAVPLNQTIRVGSRDYTFHEWEGLLKVAFAEV